MLEKDRKIIFVLTRMSLGGSASSLLNLLSLLKERGVKCDLFLLDHFGPWTKKAAELCNLLPKDSSLEAKITAKQNLNTLPQFLNRVCFVLLHKIFGPKRILDRAYQKSASKLSGKYDVVISYQESETTQYAQYIDAPTKIAWIHTDFEKFWKNGSIGAERKIYERFDHIVCVTEDSAKSVLRYLPIPQDRVHFIRNLLPAEEIDQRSLEPVEPLTNGEKFVFLSVGRLSPEKAFHRIPEVASILKREGYSFSWYLIGDGTEKKNVEERIVCFDVAECVHLLGAKMNPYPFIRLADCLVITSLHEAQPMVANEALILNTPVISTRFASVYEVLADEENGLVVEQETESIAKGLMRFMEDCAFRERLNAGAKHFTYSNEKELCAITKLLGVNYEEIRKTKEERID